MRKDLLRLANQVAAGELGIILGCRKIQAYRFELADDLDEDFLPFIGVDSQTDHLPVDEERRNWSLEALARKDIEIADAEEHFRDEVLSACKKIIARFDY